MLNLLHQGISLSNIGTYSIIGPCHLPTLFDSSHPILTQCHQSLNPYTLHLSYFKHHDVDILYFHLNYEMFLTPYRSQKLACEANLYRFPSTTSVSIA